MAQHVITRFADIAYMRYAGWKYKIQFQRKVKHSLSEYFQDMVAVYLKAILPDEYDVILEEQRNLNGLHLRPDILIQKNGKDHFILEIKTNLGWMRPDFKSEDPFGDMKKRIADLCQNFDIPEQNMFYIVEEVGNASKQFEQYYWDKKTQKPSLERSGFVNQIKPLFYGTDPYYWAEYTKARDQKYPILSYDDLFHAAENRIVTPFEQIIKHILLV